MKKFRELSGVLVGKQGLSLKQRGKIYQCCVRPVLLYCCETWELTVADKARLPGMERRMIRMMRRVRVADEARLCGVERRMIRMKGGVRVADEARLRGVERCMIRMMRGVRLVDRVSTDVLHDRVDVIVKIEDLIIQSRLLWFGHVMRGDINSQIRAVMKVEITGKKKGRPRKGNRGTSA